MGKIIVDVDVVLMTDDEKIVDYFAGCRALLDAGRERGERYRPLVE